MVASELSKKVNGSTPSRQRGGEFDTLCFRKALGAFPTGVAIVTARSAHGDRIGLTCNSFSSVSLDPPLVLWSLAKNAFSRPAFEVVERWAVNLLSSEQEDLAMQFARAGNDKFAGVEVDSGVNGGPPLLNGCVARFLCATMHIYDGGDHLIFVGRVEHFDQFERPPLVFHSGKFSRSPAGRVLQRESRDSRTL